MDPENTSTPAEEVAPVAPEAETPAEAEAPAEEAAPEAPTEPEAPAAEETAPEAPAAETPEEPVVASEGGEIRFSEQDGKHFWKRYDAAGALVFTSSFFATKEEAEADAENAA